MCFQSTDYGFPKKHRDQHLGLKRRHLSRVRLSRAASGRLSRRRWLTPEAEFPDHQGRRLSFESHLFYRLNVFPIDVPAANARRISVSRAKVVNIMMRASGNFFAIELVLQFLDVLERPP